MRVLLAMCTLFLMSGTLAATPRQRVVRRETALVVVPFAVPVATPVAVVNPTGVFYSYSPSAAAYGAASDDDWRQFEEFRRWKESRQTAASPGTPAVANSCLKCHAGAAAKGNFRLDGPLDADTRLRAIREVLGKRMPKDKPLSAGEISALVDELAAEQR
jgi:hypothetical protein